MISFAEGPPAPEPAKRKMPLVSNGWSKWLESEEGIRLADLLEIELFRSAQAEINKISEDPQRAPSWKTRPDRIRMDRM